MVPEAAIVKKQHFNFSAANADWPIDDKQAAYIPESRVQAQSQPTRSYVPAHSYGVAPSFPVESRAKHTKRS